VRIPQLHQTKVHQNGTSVRADDDILRFDISMDHALAVTVAQRIEKLSHPGNGLFLGDRPVLLNIIGEALALHELHHKIDVTSLLEEVRHPHQMGMA
jgi:hypothetical protein